MPLVLLVRKEEKKETLKAPHSKMAPEWGALRECRGEMQSNLGALDSDRTGHAGRLAVEGGAVYHKPR